MGSGAHSMGSTLTDAILKSKGQLAIGTIIAGFVAIDAEGYKAGFSEFVKTAASYEKWVIYWNEWGQKKYGRVSSLFCFHRFDELTGYLIGTLAESGRSGVSAGDFDEVTLAHLGTIQVATPDRCFFFARDLHGENKNLKARLARIEKRIQNFLE